MGLKIMIKTPPAKLPKLPCKAKPIAKPAAAIIAAKDVVGTPKVPRSVMIKRIFKIQLMRLSKNF